ncbi:hypothetical protein DL93DRAFT_2193711 [Clavulina sp. PMI_390]|nr:hypothetical protein DL93DRAFT_2193711 [Clavulina sp. PMI_390]
MADPLFSDKGRILFRTKHEVTALAISPSTHKNGGVLAYGTAKGQISVWPDTSPIASPKLSDSDRSLGEIVVIAWLAASTVHASSDLPPADLIAGDTRGWISLSWLRFPAFDHVGVEAVNLSRETLVAASDNLIVIFSVSDAHGTPKAQLQHVLGKLGECPLQSVRLVAIHKESDRGSQSLTVIEEVGRISYLDLVRGVVIESRSLGENRIGSAFFHRMPKWINSRILLGHPLFGWCYQPHISIPSTRQEIRFKSTTPDPHHFPIVVLHPDDCVIVSAPDRSIQIWDLGRFGSPRQSLWYADCSEQSRFELLEYGRVQNSYCLVTAVRVDDPDGYMVIAWDDLQHKKSVAARRNINNSDKVIAKESRQFRPTSVASGHLEIGTIAYTLFTTVTVLVISVVLAMLMSAAITSPAFNDIRRRYDLTHPSG